MNLREELLKDHSKKQCDKVALWVGDDEDRFAELIKLVFGDERKLAERAAWPLNYAAIKNPALLKPWFSKVIALLEKEKTSGVIKRNFVRIFETIDIPEKYCGALFEISVKLLHNLKEPTAVRAFSISVMYNIAKKFPELKSEVKLNAESLLHCGIPALEARGRNVVKDLGR